MSEPTDFSEGKLYIIPPQEAVLLSLLGTIVRLTSEATKCIDSTLGREMMSLL